MRVLSRVLRSFAANESGATAIEYGLICSLIFLAIVSAISAVADGTVAMYNVISAAMN
ncbi:MAG: Flp family type IVb pilin [Alphaproteobacteria bacterium]|jgi:pilus assembly protein Flp/PilA|nr:Flp family type IVb pilin [Alphaproteobacteria bacterium]